MADGMGVIGGQAKCLEPSNQSSGRWMKAASGVEILGGYTTYRIRVGMRVAANGVVSLAALWGS